MARLKYAALVVVITLAACQFLPWRHVPVAPTTTRDATPINKVGNTEVQAILDRSCKDCHSSLTSLPWYGHVAPISWLVVSHVDHGIKKWDLAVWNTRRPLHGEMEDMCDAVTDRSMPLPSYTWIHPRAKLTDHDIDTLCRWADSPPSRSVSAK
jgi:hypothetical protein